MRQSLIDLVTNTIVHQYDLPNAGAGILRTIFSTHNDNCYKAEDIDDLADIIYNSIVDYAFNEFEMEEKDLNNLHAIAMQNKLKYNPDASETVKIKYGFFGEVLLHSILIVLYRAKPLIARGYFYNPLENAETKGFDSYQLIDNNGSVELWFGEVKFHISHSSGINSVLGNIQNVLTDKYLNKNVLAIHNHRHNMNIKDSLIETILDSWESNPAIQICDEIKKYDMTLIYPILILYEKDGGDYDSNIKKIPQYIIDNYSSATFGLTVPYKVFFILLPVEKVKEIKNNVITWIESKKPLIS